MTGLELLTGAALVAIAYVIGMFPSALLIAGRDITSQGSGNPGASNTLRVAGQKAGAFVLGLDMAKGLVPTLVALVVAGRSVAALCWLAAVAGHVFPAARHFRGGKGVATGGGGAVVLFPLVGAVLAVLFVLVAKVGRKASVGSLVIAVGLVIGVVATGRPLGEIGVSAVVATLVVARHRHNIVRLLRREEASIL